MSGEIEVVSAVVRGCELQFNRYLIMDTAIFTTLLRSASILNLICEVDYDLCVYLFEYIYVLEI